MAEGTKRITCFFMVDGSIVPITKMVDTSNVNGEAQAIQAAIEENHINPYNLSFVVDHDDVTYRAEYLDSLSNFQSKKDLLQMETVVNKLDKDSEALEYTTGLRKRVAIRNQSENDWIEQHASGTLRKNKRIGFTYRTQYLAERVAYEYGYGFEILPRSQLTFGDPITEENCSPLTEAGWHIERYMSMDIFGDHFEAKYFHAAYRDGKNREGVGIIVRETSAPWVPAGHIVFAIIAEFDPYRKDWKNAINPF